jgi:predicted MFS family arabinose efflux permease
VRLPGFLAALGYRNYRLLWIGAFLSSVGTWTQDVALSWLIHTEFGNPFFLGLRSFAADAPLIGLMLLGGAVADRVDRRQILLVSQAVQMTLAAALLALYLAGGLGLGAILAIAFVTGLAQSQSAPTYQAVLTSLVPAREIPRAVAMNSLQFNLSRAIGPVIAGLLLARGGTGACFAVNVVSYAAVLVALARIRLPARPAPAKPESLRRSLQAGLAHVSRHPVLSRLTLLAALGSFLAFPLTTFLPVFADRVQGSGATGYSLLLSSYGAGAIGGAIATAQRGHVPGRGRLSLLAFALYGTLAGLALASPWQPLSMLLLFGAGWSLVTAYSTLSSLVQEHAEEALRGRILSIYGLCFRGGMPFGGLFAGALVGPLGVTPVLGTMLGMLLALAVWMLLRPGTVARL